MSHLVFVAMDEKVATWRTIWPAEELKRRGYEVSVYGVWGHPAPKAEPIKDVTYICHVINKAWNFEGQILTYVDMARSVADVAPLVLSYDDDWTRMLQVQPRPIDPLARAVHAQIPELTRMADKVIVATPRLAEVFGKWAREIHVCENVMPESILTLPRKPRMDRVVWMGEMYLHGMDWNLLGPYAGDLPPLYLVGAGEGAGERIRSWGAKDVLTTPAMLDQRKLYGEIGRGVAAVIPLQDTPFNRGKSWSKPMEFMARGVQPIASKHDEYDRLNDLTDALPTYEDPAELVEAVNVAWDSREAVVEQSEDLPNRLRKANLTMETGGGDQWEKALA